MRWDSRSGGLRRQGAGKGVRARPLAPAAAGDDAETVHQDLADLADAYGVATRYENSDRREVEVDDDVVIAILALTKKIAPPVLGFLGADPECDLPLALQPVKLNCHAAVSASFAFGGLNSVLIAKIPNSG